MSDTWPDGEPVTPWADPWHDIYADFRAVIDGINADIADDEGHLTYEHDPARPWGIGRRHPGLCHCRRREAHFA